MQDRVALLVGQATSLGASMAAALAEKGIDVALVYQDEAAKNQAEDSFGRQAREQVEKHGRRCLVFRGRPGDEGFSRHVISQILEVFNRLDIVISYSVPRPAGGEGQRELMPHLPLVRLALNQIIRSEA